jgi:hydrogenase-4 membrane subunit HyfE
MRYSKVIVALVILLNVVFTAATLYVFLRTGNEPSALIAAWFAFTTGELWFLAGIKKREISNGVGADASNRDETKL